MAYHAHTKNQINSILFTQTFSYESNEVFLVLLTHTLGNKNLWNMIKKFCQSAQDHCQEGEKNKEKITHSLSVCVLNLKLV